MDQETTKPLILDALEMALGQRNLDHGELLHHSNRGSEYASHAFQERLCEANISCSISRKGNCWEATAARRAISEESRAKAVA